MNIKGPEPTTAEKAKLVWKRLYKARLLSRLIKKGDNVIYFLQELEGGPIKIGHAENVISRLRSLQMGNPHTLVIVGEIKVNKGYGSRQETEIHRMFKGTRFRGEWYHPSAELLNFINRHNSFNVEEWVKKELEERWNKTRQGLHQMSYVQIFTQYGDWFTDILQVAAYYAEFARKYPFILQYRVGQQPRNAMAVRS